MIYATWSQGFRPGGFNRTNSCHIRGTDGINQFCLPQSYHSDDLTNYEFGWKTEFLDHHFQWNGAVYQENWNNVQVGFFDPGETGNLTFGTNGQNFRVRGLETSLVALVAPGLTMQGAASWNRSEQTNSPSLMDNNPASANFGKPITVSCSKTGTNCKPLNNLFGPIGGPSANSPPIQFNLRARYEWAINELQCIRAGRRDAYGPLVHAGRQQSLHLGGRHQHHGAAVRKSGVHDLRRVGRRFQGRVECARVFPELEQFKRERIHEHRAVRGGADGAPAAGDRH